jgi:Ca2+-binding EF-hand superfamily protein
MKMKLVSASILALCLSAPAFAESLDVILPVEPPITVTPDPTIVVTPPTLSDKAAAKALEFKATDADHDGYVIWAEFKLASDAKRDARILAAFTAADTDKNGTLSSDEFLNMFAVGEVVSPAAITQASTVFSIIDTESNSIGVITPAELALASADEKPVNALMWAFARMDANGDAKLAATEYGFKPAKLPKPPKLPKSKGSKDSPK